MDFSTASIKQRIQPMSVLRKVTSMVFGQRLLKTGSSQKISTVDHPNFSIPNKDDLQKTSKRRVTFADMEDLQKECELTEADDTEFTNNNNSSSRNIGYIRRNCAVHLTTGKVLNGETCEQRDAFKDKLIDNVLVIKDHYWIDNASVESFDVSFGKKGKGVGEFQDATNITLLSLDKMLITDIVNSRLQTCTNDGTTHTIYSGSEISEPWATCLTPDGKIALTSRRRKCVILISLDGDILSAFGLGFFEFPCGICIDKSNNFIVTDACLNRVSIHSPKGEFLKYIDNPLEVQQQLSQPRYVCICARGDIIVSDSGHHCVKVFDSSGKYVRSFGKFGKKDGELKAPYGVCTDAYGHILVADHYNNRVSMFTQEGSFVCHVIDERHGISHPKGIALSSDCNLYVTHGDIKSSEIKVFKLRCLNPKVIFYV